MKPLILLIAVTLLTVLLSFLTSGNPAWKFAGKLALSVMLLFTSTGHFKFPQGMAMMTPDPIPFKPSIILLTGLLEIVLAATIWLPAYSRISGWILIVFFIFLLPANIYASALHINLEKADFTGPGLQYLFFRIPLQLLFIGWTYFCCIAKF